MYLYEINRMASSKIFLFAQLHVRIIDDLKPIYINNLHDLNNVVNAENDALLHSFYTLRITEKTFPPLGYIEEDQLLHSIHNTGKPHIKAALVQLSKYTDALRQLELINTTLSNEIDPHYHKNVFLEGVQPDISGQRVDSLYSCNYSAYASTLIGSFNPQDDVQEPLSQRKRFRQTSMMYTAL